MANLSNPWLFKYNPLRISPALLMLLLPMMLSCSVDNGWLTLLTISESLVLSALKVKLEMQVLQSGKAFSTNAFKDKSLSNTILDVSLTVLFAPIYNVVFFWVFL